ncbi:MAG TPA: hypothetical protein PLQ13_07780, partial [Candidatus Krumholzibacteria bacterium]|nr:hypothetical protein [Candidatus Krumholzibacteria bacterium]
YRRIKRDYGDQAEVLDTRNVSRREAQGLGREKLVEVTIRVPGARRPDRPERADRPAATVPGAGAVDDLVREVERIEALVEDLAAAPKAPAQAARPALADLLEDGGARRATVDHLLARFAAETGHGPGDRAAFLTWLEGNLPASNCGWDGFYGCHAFLGAPGAGRTDLVLAAADRLQALGRRTLVLAVMPDDEGLIRRLQQAASDGGYDAAILRRAEQLQENADQLGDYDVVLVDLPALGSAAMAEGRPLHRWLAANTGFHRHFVMPLDADTGDLAELAPTIRAWSCDWLAIGRTDRSRRWAKLLDLTVTVGLPFSLLSRDPRHGGEVGIAATGELLDRILGGAPAAFVPATPVTAAV